MEVDELRFRQVVLNLVSNAVKFTPDGGTVVVRAREVGDELQVSVEDTGVGIPETDRERIFESFQQGGRGASREEGTGLGLTLSRRIVELLGGRMWLESEVGVGSTFGFAFPVRRARSESAGRRPAAGFDLHRRHRGRPPLARPDDGVPVRGGDHGRDRAGRSVRPRRGPAGPALRRAARHPDAGHRRLGGPAGAEGRPPDLGHPRHRRLDRRRALARRRARCRRLPREAGQPRRPAGCPDCDRAAGRGGRLHRHGRRLHDLTASSSSRTTPRT